MSKKEFRSIAYIYNEMDPSEKVEFERDLLQDENLLIEVESFKRVTNELQSLNSIDAPKDVLSSVLAQAKQKKNRSANTNLFNGTFYGAAAALLLAGITSGFLLLQSEQPADANAVTNSASISAPGLLQHSAQSVRNINQRVAPWVDNNEVLHFQDRLRNDGTASIDSIFRNSFQKLTPVTNPSFSNPNQQNLHLTGGRR